MYVSPSEFTEMELMWYACALAYIFRGTAATIVSWCVSVGNRRLVPLPTRGSGGGRREGCTLPECAAIFRNPSVERLFSATTFSDFSKTFHNLIVLSIWIVSWTLAKQRQDLKVFKGMLTIRAEQKVSRILPSTPFDFVDLLFDLERLEVVELRLVALEFSVELVFTALFLSVRAISDSYPKLRRKDHIKYSLIHCARTVLLAHPCRLSQGNRQYDQTQQSR